MQPRAPARSCRSFAGCPEERNSATTKGESHVGQTPFFPTGHLEGAGSTEILPNKTFLIVGLQLEVYCSIRDTRIQAT